LLLVRGETRRRELAVRVALGAGDKRLARLLITESAVLAAFGAAAGIALATLTVRLLRANAPPGLPRLAETSIDWSVLAFALVVACLTALLTGILPLAHARRIAPAGELREGGRGATSGRVIALAADASSPRRSRWPSSSSRAPDHDLHGEQSVVDRSRIPRRRRAHDACRHHRSGILTCCASCALGRRSAECRRFPVSSCCCAIAAARDGDGRLGLTILDTRRRRISAG
jgi:hypothetical protein